jgi:hypothetical protein
VPEPKLKKLERPYRLRITRVTYQGDDAAAARGIEEFLRLSRLRDRPVQTDVEEPDVTNGVVAE